MKFKKGDRVKLKKSSRFYKQSKVPGTMIVSNDPGWLRVKWDSGYKNYYHEQDLEFVKITNWRDRIK